MVCLEIEGVVVSWIDSRRADMGSGITRHATGENQLCGFLFLFFRLILRLTLGQDRWVSIEVLCEPDTGDTPKKTGDSHHDAMTGLVGGSGLPRQPIPLTLDGSMAEPR